MDQPKALKKTVLTERQARSKAEHYCAYQERSQQEVRNKLFEWGMLPHEAENIIVDLILDNFINEERFAKAYTSGKFNQNKWGKIKIKQGLKSKGIGEKMIQEVIKTLDEQSYFQALEELLEKKARILPEKDRYKRKAKLANFAASRGFESSLIFEILNNKEL